MDFLYRVAVLSPEDPNPPAVPDGWDVVYHENKMQEKWQAGFEAMGQRVDAVMMMGSDDLMTDGLVKLLHVAALERGMSHPTTLYYADPAQRRIFHAQYRTVFAGCTYAVDVARKVKGKLFVANEPSDLAPDVVSATKMRPLCPAAYAAPRCDVLGEAVVDIKTTQNVWAYDHVAHRARNRMLDAVDYDDFFGTYFPGFVSSPLPKEKDDGLQGFSA